MKAWIAALMITLPLLTACGGGSGGSTEETPTSPTDTTTRQLLGDWYLPVGCTPGPDTAKFTLSESTLNDLFVLNYQYWDNGKYYNQSLFNVDIKTTTNNNGTTLYSYSSGSTRPSGQQDLYLQGTLRLQNSQLQIDALCNATGLEQATPLTPYNDNMVNDAQINHLSESLSIRLYYLDIFNADWLPIKFDLSRRGLLGGSAECDARRTLADAHLSTVINQLGLNALKYDILNLPVNWSTATYQIMIELDINDLSLSTCDLTELVNTQYATLQ